MIDRRLALFGAGATALLSFAPAGAVTRTHVVRMLTSDPSGSDRRMFFDPRILRIAAGDIVTFEPTQPSHSCVSTPGMLPQGAQGWTGAIGRPVSVTFKIPGYYGYHCMPHRSLGMVGLVIVEGRGRDANLEAAKSVRQLGKAKEVWEAIWAEALS